VTRHRFAVVLLVTGRVANEIDGLRRALGARSLERIEPHVTLIPPRNVGEDDSEAVMSLLRAGAAASSPISVELGPPATFWPINPVLYLSVSGDLTEIADLRERLSAGPLAPPEGRQQPPFVPHATLDQRIDPDKIGPALIVLGNYRAAVTFERVTLLEQDEQHHWQAVADVSLGRPAIVGRGGLEVELSVSERSDPATARFADDEWDSEALGRRGPQFDSDRPFVVTARREGALVGVAEGYTRGLVCHLSGLIVAAAVRGEGVGSQLLRTVERLGRERGCDRVRLLTVLGGRAERFYAERGYEVTVNLPVWRNEEDFVAMERRL
jgi:2'-5' RNA ligase/GNAT superfamily N-acetyltransferase